MKTVECLCHVPSLNPYRGIGTRDVCFTYHLSPLALNSRILPKSWDFRSLLRCRGMFHSTTCARRAFTVARQRLGAWHKCHGGGHIAATTPRKNRQTLVLKRHRPSRASLGAVAEAACTPMRSSRSPQGEREDCTGPWANGNQHSNFAISHCYGTPHGPLVHQPTL